MSRPRGVRTGAEMPASNTMFENARTRSGVDVSYGAPGPGRWITIYAQPAHAYMVVRGRRFDTSGQGSGSRWQWESRSAAGYTVRHPPGL